MRAAELLQCSPAKTSIAHSAFQVTTPTNFHSFDLNALSVSEILVQRRSCFPVRALDHEGTACSVDFDMFVTLRYILAIPLILAILSFLTSITHITQL